MGPFEKAPLNTKFAISLIDYHSKWPEVGFVEKVTSQSVITFLTSVLSREGFPLEIVTDHGPQFISKEFESFLEERKIFFFFYNNFIILIEFQIQDLFSRINQ